MIIKMITIEEFMTENPFTLSSTDFVADAWRVMMEKNIRHIPITDGKNHLLGLVTQRDVLASTKPMLKDEAEKSTHVVGMDIMLSEIMIKNITVIDKNESLREAAVFMQSHKYGCLPVIADGSLIGIITDSDFIAIAINLLEQVELAEDDFEAEPSSDEIEASDVNNII